MKSELTALSSPSKEAIELAWTKRYLSVEGTFLALSFLPASIIFPTLRSEALADPEVTTVLATVDPADALMSASITTWSSRLAMAFPSISASSALSSKFTLAWLKMSLYSDAE